MKDLQTWFMYNPQLRKLLPSNSHILIAISGGMDSVVLTHLFRKIYSEYKYKLTLAHINHSLRDDANKDMKFVCDLAKEWNIPCETMHLNPKTKDKNESVEAWAREKRYLALEKIRKKVQADFICTAHHKSDQAETILMRLALGTGGKGLKGIRSKTGNIRRPLLQFLKTELIDYSQQHGLSFVEDETNLDITIPRNFIRHNIISPWKKQCDHIENGIFKTSSNISDLVDAVSFSVEYFYNKFVKIENDPEEISLMKSDINSLPTLLQLHLIKKCIGLEKYQWRQHNWNDLRSFLVNSETGNILGFESNWKILNNRSQWILFKSNDKLKSSFTVFPNGTSYCGDYIINWEWFNQPITISNRDPNSEFIDGSVIENRKLQLRPWHYGDKFQPLGMEGRKKVSDFLIDEKVNLYQKSNQMVLAADNEIVWVCGYRISDWVKVTTNTLRPAKITLGLNR